MGFQGVDWFQQVKDSVQWSAHKNTLKNLQVP
jgi:hypothetical protein